MTVCIRRDLTQCVCRRPDASPLSCCQGCCQPQRLSDLCLIRRAGPRAVPSSDACRLSSTVHRSGLICGPVAKQIDKQAKISAS